MASSSDLYVSLAIAAPSELEMRPSLSLCGNHLSNYVRGRTPSLLVVRSVVTPIAQLPLPAAVAFAGGSQTPSCLFYHLLLPHTRLQAAATNQRPPTIND